MTPKQQMIADIAVILDNYNKHQPVNPGVAVHLAKLLQVMLEENDQLLRYEESGVEGGERGVEGEARRMMMSPWRSKVYRDAAYGQRCVFCGVSDATVVGCHIRLRGFCGTGTKPPDFMLVDACRVCHDEYGDMNHPDLAEDVLRGLCRTLERRFEEGVLQLKEDSTC